MPKTKKLDDSSSSDSDSSGPRDRNPPPSKKSKSDSSAKSAGAGSSSKPKKSEDETWSLDARRMVKINEFRGKVFVDIREYYEQDGELKPGKKGISLSAAQYQKLKDIIPDVDEALKNH